MRILVAYATKQGQTRAIAEHVGAALRARDMNAELIDVGHPYDLDLADYDAVVLAASVHMGEHEKEMIRFVRERRAALESLPTAFLSVSMSEGAAEDETNSPEKRAGATQRVQEQIEGFFRQTEWKPDRVQPVAGALMYTKYGFLIRFVMKMIAKRTGTATDTSRDHIYTDFAALDRFVGDLVATLR